jgi:hypothetical protein
MDQFRNKYQLRQHNIYCPNTCPESDCPNWMQMGSACTSGWRSWATSPTRWRKHCQWLEVYHACYTALLGLVPFQKGTLEGKIQRQLGLLDWLNAPTWAYL